jgi:hypothetical protein
MRYFLTILMVCASLACIPSAKAENTVPAKPAQTVQQPSPEQTKQLDRLVEILQTVASPDGHLDKALHDEFWKIINDNNLATEIDFSRVNDESNKFDVEVWQSIKLSFEKGKVTKSPDYSTYKAQMQKKYPSDQLNDSIKRYESMMESAAKKEPVTTSKGKVNLTEELINKTIADLEASYKRRNQLMKKDWVPEGQ